MTTDGFTLVLGAAVLLLVLAVVLAVRARRLARLKSALTSELARANAGIADGVRTLEQQRAAFTELEEALGGVRHRFEQIVAAVPAAIVTYDANGVIVSEEGGALVPLFGEARSVGHRVEEARPFAAANVRRALAGERFSAVETLPDRRVETSYAPIPSGVLAVSIDMRERDGLERARRLSEDRARQMFEEAPFGAALVAVDGRILRANAALGEALGFTPAELGALRLADLLHPEDAGSDERQRERLARGEAESYRVEQRLRRKDGDVAIIEVTNVAVRDAERRLSGRLVMVRDVSGRRHDEVIAEQFARRDAVTGLPNRIAFEERLRELVLKAGREHERLGLVVFDVHNAASLAERIGVRGRDATLRALAARLQSALPEVETLSRVGVVTFAFTLARRGAAGTAQVVENLVAALAEGLPVDGQRVFADLRLGFAMFPEDASEPDMLLRRADAALATATHGGRRYTRYLENAAV